MDKTIPEVSILMTFLNPGFFFAPAVESLLNQTFSNFELIAIDDGSTDGSLEWLKTLEDTRIVVVEPGKRLGRTPALNAALSIAQGEFIAVLDADDISKPTRLQEQVDYLRDHPDCVLVGTNFEQVDERDRVLNAHEWPSDPDDVYQLLCSVNPIAHSSSMYRRAAAELVGGYPSKYAYAQDYGLWLRLARVGGVAILPRILVSIREHSQQMTVVPEYLVARGMDAKNLFDEAARLPGMSGKARRANRRERGLARYRIALNMVRMRRPFQALAWGIRGTILAPFEMMKRLLASAMGVKMHPL
ncbi:MAG: glycosyltransferase [Alphaproteobacteria bacterium]|nr:glycosyltransferase [Alphaproteobacteria bacterium]